MSGQLVCKNAQLSRGTKRLLPSRLSSGMYRCSRGLDYSGPIADAVALRLQAPSRAGVYRLRLVKGRARIETVSAAFVVGRP